MSNVNIKRAVENIRANTTVYTPVIEVIVNAIQAIDESTPAEGKVQIRLRRSDQKQLDDSLPDVIGFEIEDNGVGFTEVHRESFDTLYSDLKIAEGGKGFGRFAALKYFSDIHVTSVYRDNTEGHMCRRFSMGTDNQIIVDETIGPSGQKESGTIVKLRELRKGSTFEKKITTIARNLVVECPHRIETR